MDETIGMADSDMSFKRGQTSINDSSSVPSPNSTVPSAPSSASSSTSPATSSAAASSSSSSSSLQDDYDVPLAQSPITQVTTRENDAPLTGAQIAHHHKKSWFRTIFCCWQKPPSHVVTPIRPKPSLPNIPRPQDVLLAPQRPEDQGKKCLVLDLDETLVHSSFKPVPNADYVIPVEIENQNHNVFVLKRPGVDEFLRTMGLHYEIVVFTASLAKYADPVLDQLDILKVVRYRLFRESCFFHKGNYVKDLSRLGRDIRKTIIIDNSPAAYMFQPENALAVTTWFDDPNDNELTEITDFLIELAKCDDVIETLQRVQNES
jgi:RNA polymerase II subunit A small phosphatase-like protein